MERAAVVGLGVVGRTMVALGGKSAVGIDLDPERVDLCRTSAGDATDDLSAIRGRTLVFLCVGTPAAAGGRYDGAQVERVLNDIEGLLDPEAQVVIRSTIAPESLPRDYPNAVVVNPEFLRAENAMQDALHPPFVVVGVEPEAAASRVLRWYEACGVSDAAPKLVCTPVEAILLKFACNWFHSVKVEFANMIGELARGLETDGTRVMEMFVRDRILNISERYLKPGRSFGGGCLPKDLDIGVSMFKDLADVRLLEAVASANRARAAREGSKE